jgi:hypothetical protein
VALAAPVSRPAAPAAAAQLPAEFWLIGFLLVQIACQVALLFEAVNPYRVAVRCLAFGSGLALLLVVMPGQLRKPHPARRAALLVLVVVGLNIVHPASNTPAACLAQFGLYAAILGPLFWVGRLDVPPAAFRRLLIAFWGFYTVSAAVGVLQVYDPARWQPSNISSVVLSLGAQAEGLKIKLADGREIWRPMGLTDMPGGAAGAGL